MTARKLRRGVLAAGLVAALASGGCAAGPEPSGNGERSPVNVFAAASLRAVFEQVAANYEENNPRADVVLNFAGSSDLATQITAGAPADVFAAADTAVMQRLVDEGLIDGAPSNFAGNTLTIAVPPGNPKRITSFADLARPAVKVVACAPQVPCGTAAQKVQQQQGVRLSPVSEESSVTDVLGKVVSGEADAGLVYVTDVATAGTKVEEVKLADSAAGRTTYPIAAVRGGNTEDARRFIAAVLSPSGDRLLREAGFRPPEESG